MVKFLNLTLNTITSKASLHDLTDELSYLLCRSSLNYELNQCNIGNIPRCLAVLSKLTKLNLGNNKLTGNTCTHDENCDAAAAAADVDDINKL